MPLFTTRLNTLADSLVSSAVLVYLHTSAPSDSSPAAGRTTAGAAGMKTGSASLRLTGALLRTVT